MVLELRRENVRGGMAGLEDPRVGRDALAGGIERLVETVPSRPAGDLDDDQLLAKSRNCIRWDLTVTGVGWIAPKMLRLTVSAPGLATMEYLPGHDFTVLVARAGGRSIRRRYTIAGRDSDDAVHLDVYVHGEGIGTTWAQTRRPGDSLSAIGPRGSFVLGRRADWHVLIGDETSIPGIHAMLAATDGPAYVVVEVDDPSEWQPLGRPTGRPHTNWIWRPRRAARYKIRAPALPTAGIGHAYISGEASLVSAWRAELEGLGMDSAAITHKAYWGSGRANATHGEPLA
jgi:NADPH-dependent ferric siderophore reductase